MKRPSPRKLLTPSWQLVQTRIPPDLARWLSERARRKLLPVATELRLLIAAVRDAERLERPRELDGLPVPGMAVAGLAIPTGVSKRGGRS